MLKRLGYRTFEIDKSDGSKRTIREPNKALKAEQRYILSVLPKEKYDSVQGFVTGKSIVSNAIQHIDAKWSVHIDIKEFFPTINASKVRELFDKHHIPPHYVTIATDELRLPQGAPSSPRIANLVAYLIDERLNRLAQKLRLVYTRYADDITISGIEDIDLEKLQSLIYHIIESSGFKVKKSKTRIYYGTTRIVTGIRIREKRLFCSPIIYEEIERLAILASRGRLSRRQAQKLQGYEAFVKHLKLFNRGLANE